MISKTRFGGVWASGASVGALILMANLTSGCEVPPSPPELGPGTGSYPFTGYAPLADKPISVHYHVPQDAEVLAPIVVVFHGDGRNADEYRDAWVDRADAHGFVIVAPEFSEELFPGSSAYALGNVFVDGDAPSPEEERPSELWTFSVVDPLVADFAARVGNLSTIHHMFGHSAGAQFAHRLVLFRPDGRYGYVIAANAGWYTVPDPGSAFPYGLAGSPGGVGETSYFEHRLSVQAGSEDDDPDSASLRRTKEANAQGPHRLARAQHFVTEGRTFAQQASEPYAWSFTVVEGVGHDHVQMGERASEWLATRVGL